MQLDSTTSLSSIERDYLLGDMLGTGGMGTVYSATQRSLGRRVAIKVPHPELVNDPMVIRRFRAEALAGGRLDHRNIARVIDLFAGVGGGLYLVMEYVAGTPLDKIVVQRGALDTLVAIDVCGQILAGLEAAHTANIIHADIKSANVLVETLPDGAVRAVVIDFGLARTIGDRSEDDSRMVSGTPDYIAPELIRGGAPTVASDIYAAGVVLYELLTGTTPFGGGTSTQIMDRHLFDPVVLPSLRNPDQPIPAALESVAMCALAKDPDARFATIAAFRIALCNAAPAVLHHPRLSARGTQPSAFSLETPTRDWLRDRESTVNVAAPIGIETNQIEQLRASVRGAFAGGDADMIVASYLELARALIDGGNLVAAAGELERGLALLRPTVSTTEAPQAIWRLQLCLAALYSGLGEPARARTAAVRGQDDAVRAASTVGEDRADALLLRLARHVRS